MNIMTNKKHNMFRDGKKRLSAKEAMVASHRRLYKVNESSIKTDEVKVGIYGMMQVIFIYNTWYMEDKTSILDNI